MSGDAPLNSSLPSRSNSHGSISVLLLLQVSSKMLEWINGLEDWFRLHVSWFHVKLLRHDSYCKARKHKETKA